MRLLSICTAALLLPAMLFAQGDQKPSASAVHKKFAAELAKQGSDYTNARKALQKSDAYMSARKARDNKALRKLLSSLKTPDAVGLAEKAVKAAANYDSEGACKLISWAAVICRDTKMIQKLVPVIEANHIKDRNLDELLENGAILSRPLGKDEARRFLDKVIAESPHDVPKAWAFYWKAKLVGQSGRGASVKEEVAKLLAKAEQLGKGSLVGDMIAGPRFKQERLQKGMVAPNIVGEDIDGVKFELNDYRGKVVVLDFWGFW